MASETTPSPSLYYRDPNLTSGVVCWFCLKYRCGGIRDDSETVDESSCDLCRRDLAAVQRELEAERKRDDAHKRAWEKSHRDHLRVIRGQLLALFEKSFDPSLPRLDPERPLLDTLDPSLRSQLLAKCNAQTGELSFIDYCVAGSNLVMLAEYRHPDAKISHCIVRWMLDGADERRSNYRTRARAKEAFRKEAGLGQPWHFWLGSPRVRQIIHEEWQRLDGQEDKKQRLKASVYAVLKTIGQLYELPVSQKWLVTSPGQQLSAERHLEENATALLGEKTLRLRHYYPYYGSLAPSEIELTPAEFLYLTWRYACAGGASQTGPSASYLEPSERLGKTIPKKVRLIRQVLGELGQHRNEDKTGWVAVPLARLCKPVGVRASGKQYSALRKLMEDLAACRIVHDDGKRWGNAFRLLGAPTDVPTRQSVRDRQDKIDEILASPQK